MAGSETAGLSSTLKETESSKLCLENWDFFSHYWAIPFLRNCQCNCGMEFIQPKIKILKSIGNLCLTPWELVAQRNSCPQVKSQKQPVYINAPEDKVQQLRSVKIHMIFILYSALFRVGKAASYRRAGPATVTTSAATSQSACSWEAEPPCTSATLEALTGRFRSGSAIVWDCCWWEICKITWILNWALIGVNTWKKGKD